MACLLACVGLGCAGEGAGPGRRLRVLVQRGQHVHLDAVLCAAAQVLQREVPTLRLVRTAVSFLFSATALLLALNS